MVNLRTLAIILGVNLLLPLSLFATSHDEKEEPSVKAQRQAIGSSIEFKSWGITEREMEEAFNTSEHLICLMEFGGYFKRLNANWTKVLGWQAEELLNTPYYQFIHPDDMDKTLEYENEFIPRGFVNRYRSKKGSYRWLSWIGLSNLKRKKGQPSFAIVQDVTLDILLKQESAMKISSLNEHINFQTSVIESIIDIQRLYLGDLGHYGDEKNSKISFQHIIQHFVRLSESEFGFIERISSINFKEASTKTWEANPLLSQEDQQKFKIWQAKGGLIYFDKLIEQVAFQNKPLLINNVQDYFKETGLSDDNSTLKSFLGIPLTSRNETVGILGVANRVGGYNELLLKWFEPLFLLTGRIVNEVNLIDSHKKIQKIYLEKEKAEAKNEAKSAFLAHMSHELRTPVGGLIGLLGLINTEKLEQDDLNYLQMAQETGASLLTLLNDILDLSKIEESKLTLEVIEFNPFNVTQEVVKLLSFSAKNKGLSFKLNFDCQVPDIIIGDPTRFRQILINLIGNAIKFTDNGSVKVALDGKALEREEKYLLKGTVKDTGIGISADTVTRLFQPFSQADESMARRYQGSGLGLYITKSLCELMGGNISVKSTEGKGSIFQFEVLLRLPQEMGGPGPIANSKIADMLPPLQILVAEDNRANQLLLRVMLERSGCKVTIASNGIEALKAVEGEHFDLILMDGQMPEMDGLEATRRIRKLEEQLDKKRNLPIIGVSAHAMTTDKEKFINSGMNGYITKPVNKIELYTEILRCIKKP
jgi:PAS domain S-box-containing protein